jgi:hypothetical protein
MNVDSRLAAGVGLLFTVFVSSTASAQTKVKTLDGLAAGDNFGWSVANVGDVDGDAIDDFAVGAPFSGVNGTESGQVLVYSGRTTTVIHSWAGLGPQDYFGYAIAAAGDVDGDGFADVIVGAPESKELYDPSSSVTGPGYVQVFSGQSGVVLHHVAGPGTQGALGEAVAGGEDVDGDNVPDVIAGRPRGSGALVISGATGATIRNHADADGFGNGCALLGDVDGDGRSDYAIGAPWWFGVGSGEMDGRVKAFSGATGAQLWEFHLSSGGEELGWSMARAGDLNGDGIGELLVHRHGDGCWPSWNCNPGVSVVDPVTGLVIRSHNYGGSGAVAYGYALTDLGDIDADGVSDYAAGVPSAEPYSWPGMPSDYARIWSGANGGLLGTLNASPKSVLYGFSLAHVDGNGDGLADILLGDPWDDSAGAHAGRVHVYSFVRSPTNYCKAKPNSLGCLPYIQSAGTPSVSSGLPFRIRAFAVLNKKSGLLFYSFTPQSAPFQGGKLCAKPPIKRCTVMNSGGNPPPPDCSGSFSYDFNDRIRLGVDPALVAGEEVFAQYWSRDPADAFGTSLTDALAFFIEP